MTRTLSENGISLIKQFEGCILKVYLDSSGVKTCGCGHTGDDVNSMEVGQAITQTQADSFLKSDVEKFEKAVNKFMNVYCWTQNQFDALVSFAYNIGNIIQLTANGTRTNEVIASKILEYTKSSGKELSGLVKRRQAEHDLFVKDMVSTKSNEEIAKEVIAGKWGNGEERKTRLTNAGYDYEAIRKIVNNLFVKDMVSTKSNEEIAKEVIAGKWGNGEERKTRLTNAGYDYEAIRKIVNNLLK